MKNQNRRNIINIKFFIDKINVEALLKRHGKAYWIKHALVEI